MPLKEQDQKLTYKLTENIFRLFNIRKDMQRKKMV